MSTPNRSAKKAAAIDTTAAKARTAASKATTKTTATTGSSLVGSVGNRPVTPTVGKTIGNKGKGPVYEVPKPVKPRPQKK